MVLGRDSKYFLTFGSKQNCDPFWGGIKFELLVNFGLFGEFWPYFGHVLAMQGKIEGLLDVCANLKVALRRSGVLLVIWA